MILNLSQLSFLAFPILGILIHLIIWIVQKDKVKGVDQAGRSILNFQISWVLIFFSVSGALLFAKVLHISLAMSISSMLPFLFLMYAYNVIVVNSFLMRLTKRHAISPQLDSPNR
jgi:uncharacterized Tic20 family protein